MNLPPNALALTTYETLINYQSSFAEISWSVIVADETQKIKNSNALLMKAIKAIKYDFIICIYARRGRSHQKICAEKLSTRILRRYRVTKET